MQVPRDVARRFLLGKQGLWPGRRWRDLEGVAQAMRTMGDVQLDPLQVVAHQSSPPEGASVGSPARAWVTAASANGLAAMPRWLLGTATFLAVADSST